MIPAKPVVVVAMLALAGLAAAQEKADGKRIAELVELLKEGGDWEASATELMQLGSPATLSLAQTLFDDLEKTPEDQAWKTRVLDTLTLMGPEAAPAATLLHRVLERLPMQLTAAGIHTLAEVAPYAESQVKLNELSGDGSTFFTIGLQLGADRRSFTVRGEESRETRAMLVDIQDEVRRLSARSIDRYWNQPLPAIEEILRVQAQSPTSRIDVDIEAIIESLERRRIESDNVTLLLGTLLRQRSQRDRLTSTLSLKFARVALGTSTNDAVTALAYGCILTEHFDPAVRRAAAMRIGTYLEIGARAVPDLIAGTQDSNASVAAETVTALGMIGPAAKDAIPTLEKLTEHEDPQIAERAKAALRQVRGA